MQMNNQKHSVILVAVALILLLALVSFASAATNTIAKPSCSKTAHPIIHPNPMLKADFEYPEPCLYEPIQFKDTTKTHGGIFVNSWYWDFGDGYCSTLDNPVHYYSSPGEYDVTLKVACVIGDSHHLTSTAIHHLSVHRCQSPPE